MASSIARFRFVAITLVGAGVAFASMAPQTMAQAITQDVALDSLFAQLRAAPDAMSAGRIADQIWQRWTSPDDDKMLSLRMMDVLEMRQRAGPSDVIALVDDILADYPSYAEAWNQRATMNYMLGDYDSSLADIAKVLEFEPRHFGALAGRAMIYKSQGKDDLARADIIAALAIHPFLVERAMFPDLEGLKFI